MKKIKYYVLYDENDFPNLYFDTLKEFSISLGYNYKKLKNRFCNVNDFIDLLIGKKHFKLYKFEE